MCAGTVFIEWVGLNCVCRDCVYRVCGPEVCAGVVYRVGGPELCVQGLCL